MDIGTFEFILNMAIEFISSGNLSLGNCCVCVCKCVCVGEREKVTEKSKDRDRKTKFRKDQNTFTHKSHCLDIRNSLLWE